MKRLLFGFVSTVALLGHGSLVHAQSAPAAEAAPQVAATPQEIVVTATRRDERARDVPEAVTVVSGQALSAIGPVKTTADVLSVVPGARFNDLGNPLLSEISIRGSGTERATGADSSVGLYANGVYIGSSGNGGRNLPPIDSFDLNHVEVLEGPQGALYGRDAEYGVINLISQQPTYSNSAQVDDIYGFENAQNRATAIVNYKLDDHWALRFSVQDIKQSRGFFYNPDHNTYYDHTDGYMLRAQVRYSSDRLDVNLLAQRQQLQVPSFWSADDVQPKNATTGFPGLATFPLGYVQNPYVLPHNGADFAEEDINNVLLSVNYNFGWAKLTSTSSWRTLDTTQDVDNDYIDLAAEAAVQALGEKGNYPFSQNNTKNESTTYYEDLHLAGAPVFGNRLTWLGGLELLSQPTDNYATANGNPCATSSSPNPVVGKGACAGTPADPLCVPILTGSTCPKPVSPYGSVSASTGAYRSWATYASLTYKIGWGFAFAGDLRYSHDHKTVAGATSELYTNGTPYPYLTGGTVPPVDASLDKGNWTYTATLSYKLPGPWDDMLYTKYGTGYRVGGFNLGSTPPLAKPPYPAGATAAVNYAPVVPSYQDETSESYEIGIKGKITRWVDFTLDAYYQETAHALAAVSDGCTATDACEAANTNYTVNAGTVHGSGVEAQIDTVLHVYGGVLTLQADASNQTAKYVSNPAVGPNGEKLNGLPLVGTQIAENPHWLASFTAGYRRPITNEITGFFNLQYHGQWGGIQDPITTQGVAFRLANYQDVNLRTGFDIKSFEIALLVSNLTNESHPIAQYEQAGVNTLTGAATAVYTQQRLNIPRVFSVELKYTW